MCRPLVKNCILQPDTLQARPAGFLQRVWQFLTNCLKLDAWTASKAIDIQLSKVTELNSDATFTFGSPMTLAVFFTLFSVGRDAPTLVYFNSLFRWFCSMCFNTSCVALMCRPLVQNCVLQPDTLQARLAGFLQHVWQFLTNCLKLDAWTASKAIDINYPK